MIKAFAAPHNPNPNKGKANERETNKLNLYNNAAGRGRKATRGNPV